MALSAGSPSECWVPDFFLVLLLPRQSNVADQDRMCLLFLGRLQHYVSLFDSISKLVYVSSGQKDTNDLTASLYLKIEILKILISS